MVLLETKNISKSYGTIDALKNVNLSFLENKIYGLFGRNGAGKTTLLDIISSRIFADQGTITCFEKDITNYPDTITDYCCYMPEKHYFPVSMKVKSILSYAQKSYSNYDIETEKRLSKIFNLNEKQKYKQLSTGYQSIVKIIIGLSSNSEITILDEPVSGLDAVSRDIFYRELINSYSENPRLFIISTHLIEESADLFNEAIIIDKGEVLRQDTVESLLTNTFYVSGKSANVDNFTKDHIVISSQIINDLKTAVVEGVISEENSPPGLRFSPITIQKLFIHLTNNQNEQEL